MSALFDPGAQPERTMLAWQRTVLALAAASGLATRLTADELGAVGVVGGLTGIGLSVAAYLAASRRYGRAHRSLAESGRLPGDGTALALIVAAAVLLSVGATAYVLTVPP